MKLRYIETGSTDAFYNLAFEEYILKNETDGSWLMLWQNSPTVVVGLNQNTEEEINRDFVEANGINVVRRTTGGGAVFHDLGNLNYSFVSDLNVADMKNSTQFTAPICNALKRLGVYAYTSGKNDILVAGKKISGMAQRIYNNRILHHGTLLVDSDVTMLNGALNADPEKYTSKSVKSVSSRVGMLRDYLQGAADVKCVKDAILVEVFGDYVQTESLSPAALAEIAELAENKYRTWEWNYGKSPDYNYKNKARFSGGSVCITLNILEGIIVAAGISGDFMATEPADTLVNALIGTRFDRADIANAIGTLPLDTILGSVSREELLSLF